MEEPFILLALLAFVLALVPLGRRLSVPDPVVLVLGGLVISLIPGTPRVELDPQLFLFGILPVLLFDAAVDLPARQLREIARGVASLAVGLVFFTTAAVAVLAHSLLDMSWGLSFVLGAVVSPPDPVVATAVARQVGLPLRLRTLLEGEGLFNDGISLVLYRVSVAAVVGGGFALLTGVGTFVTSVVVGVAVGMALGGLARLLLRAIHDPIMEDTVVLALPFTAYLSAEQLHGSGVLAALVAGLLFSQLAPRGLTSAGRLQGRTVLDLTVFVLTGLSFVLVGLELRPALDDLGGQPLLTVVGIGLLVSVVLLIVRFAWVFGASWLRTLAARHGIGRGPVGEGGWRGATIVSWSGARGAVSLAAALSLPRALDDGSPFGERGLVVFIAFVVVLVTLVVQGSTLGPLARLLNITASDEVDQGEAVVAGRALLAQAAIERIDDLQADGSIEAEVADLLRHRYEQVLEASGRDRAQLAGRRTARLAVLAAEREALARADSTGDLSHTVVRRLRFELDEEVRRLT